MCHYHLSLDSFRFLAQKSWSKGWWRLDDSIHDEESLKSTDEQNMKTIWDNWLKPLQVESQNLQFDDTEGKTQEYKDTKIQRDKKTKLGKHATLPSSPFTILAINHAYHHSPAGSSTSPPSSE